ncbi:hypothetical protein MKW94_023739 [Papaver nudicaule]|uniref:Xyloglucan endotransglucosylase/hydrolase n=1 Tax=Papaver nudicaule TaxID=74823 RepID=A0AA41RZ91_PAPNU|nr:hypothetical protein [Papaver nudicaule]
MGSSSCLVFPLAVTIVVVLCIGCRGSLAAPSVGFDQSYKVTWGGNHVSSLDQGQTIRLSMDSYSGAGFASKLSYGSGYFRLRMKLPNKNTAGVVTAFYLTSGGRAHDELDFEFLGNKEGKPHTLQTNVFANGGGNREQRITLWFDPSASYHNYKILWNPYQIVFFIDHTPIRVYKNKASIGVNYPTKPMHIEASLWNGDSWATDGGQTKIDWSQAPFNAYFQAFNIDGCAQSENCYSSKFWWNNKNKYWRLNSQQQKAYQNVKKKYMTYDYCSDLPRFPKLPKECPQ